MTYVVSLVGFMPPQRYDFTPWTIVKFEEAPAPGGPWTLIDTQTLPDPDSDPSEPIARNLTTTSATLLVGWYRLTFMDVHGASSTPSDQLRNSAMSELLPPTPDQVRNESRLLRQGYPIPPTDPYATADLRNTVYQATSLVQSITWRLIDSTLGDLAPEGYLSEAVPDGLVPIAIQAIARMSERIYVTTDPDFAQQVATGRRLRGFSAGPYSESYFAPGEFARKGASQGRPPMDVDDALDTALWALATEDARDYFVWRSTGTPPPAGSATVFDYRRNSTGYHAGSMGLRRGSGPDGF